MSKHRAHDREAASTVMSLSPRLQQLDAKLSRLIETGDDPEPMTLSELDGFVAGLLVCPNMILPSQWISFVLGNGGARGSDAELGQCILLVLEHYHAVSRDLQRGRYAPLFDVDPRHDEVLWEIWIGGFKRAMSLDPESWLLIARDDTDGAALAMTGMIELITIADRGENMDPEKISVLTKTAPDLIKDWVEVLDGWRLLNATDRPARAQSNKVGRNEPCPCGSGKKHKKCCALTDSTILLKSNSDPQLVFSTPSAIHKYGSTRTYSSDLFLGEQPSDRHPVGICELKESFR